MEKKKFNYNEKKKILVQNLDGLLPTGWARHRARRRGRAGVGRLGTGALGRWGAQAWALVRWAGRWGAGLGAAGSWARGRERACADGHGRAQGVHAQAGKRVDVRALGARGAGSERQDAR